jgi:hypothetical protein
MVFTPGFIGFLLIVLTPVALILIDKIFYRDIEEIPRSHRSHIKH